MKWRVKKWEDMSLEQKLETLRYSCNNRGYDYAVYFLISLSMTFLLTGVAVYFPFFGSSIESVRAIIASLFRGSFILAAAAVSMMVFLLVWALISRRRYVKRMGEL